ncbi:MAG: PAS domain S-box protein [Melioribacteraceae bacterium]|nr:PAS domain S-box protein [Melioribacteraceae bacterium]
MKKKKIPADIKSPLKISLIYLVISALWISLSDRITFILFEHPDDYAEIQLIKGIIFVVLSSLIIFTLVKRDTGIILNKNEEILENEKLFRSVFEDATIGKSITKLDGTLNSNKAFADMLGYTLDEFNKNNWQRYTLQEDIDKSEKAVNSLIEGKESSVSFEKRYVHKNGGIIWAKVHSKLQRDKNGNPEYFISSVSNITEQKRIEGNLRKSEERFRDIVENAPDPIFIQTELKFVYLNPSACRLFGIKSQEELLGTNVMERFHPAFHNKIIARIKKLNEERKSVPELQEQKFIRVDGSEVWVETAGEPITYEGKNGALVFVRDISSRKAAEKALIESEKKFKDLFYNHAAIKLLIDPSDGSIIEANKAAAKFYGWSVEELVKMNISEINTLPFEKLKTEILIAEQPENTHFEMLHRKADGNICAVEVFSSGIEIAGQNYLHSIVHDVSDKKKVESQIKLLSRAIEQSPVSIIITNSEGIIEYVNYHLTRVSGFEREELLGQNPRIFKSGKQITEFYTELWNNIKAGKRWEGELQNRKKNGDLFWEYVIISPLITPEGIISHFIAVKEDITERKRMLEELVVAKEKAELSDKLKSEFLAQMSHEIRTPLHGITSFVQLLKDDLGDHLDPEKREMFDSIDIAGKRLRRTIDSILNMSELTLKSYTPGSDKVDLNLILNNLIRESKTHVELKKLSIELINELADPVIVGDEYSIIQILTNLIDNALKYTDEGRIRISLEEADESKLKVAVADTGRGISKEYLNELFKPFTQEDSGYSRRYEGNGLGLALVKEYCNINNAEISVQSEKGVGSTFTVIFKRSP